MRYKTSYLPLPEKEKAPLWLLFCNVCIILKGGLARFIKEQIKGELSWKKKYFAVGVILEIDFIGVRKYWRFGVGGISGGGKTAKVIVDPLTETAVEYRYSFRGGLIAGNEKREGVHEEAGNEIGSPKSSAVKQPPDFPKL